mmetsp:Transcript_7856/g.16852  ORF Transcript_7856/g.16852 Transcript_7856/m.16852 type:complete len:365 (+) Transcript_7856:2-1096(+)
MAHRQCARAMEACHVVVLVLDAEKALRSQRVMSHRELSLAALVLSEGKALVVAANKADVLRPEERALYRRTLRSKLQERFVEVGEVPVVEMSALTGQGVERLLPQVKDMYKAWNKRVSTSRLNRFVHKLPAVMGAGGTELALRRIKYITQIKARPPTFVVFVGGSQPVSESFTHFLASQVRSTMGFEGVPVRLWFRYKESRKTSKGQRVWAGRSQQRKRAFAAQLPSKPSGLASTGSFTVRANAIARSALQRQPAVTKASEESYKGPASDASGKVQGSHRDAAKVGRSRQVGDAHATRASSAIVQSVRKITRRKSVSAASKLSSKRDIMYQVMPSREPAGPLFPVKGPRSHLKSAVTGVNSAGV